MADTTVVRTLIIRGKAEGVDQVTRQTEQLARSLEHVAVASDSTTKRALSIESAYRRQTLALDQAAKAQDQIAKATKTAELAQKQGLITHDQLRERVQLIESAYNKTASANDNFVNKSKLTRYELVNLSRQAQDVAVSLASGQGFGTVLIQQGSQIFDVFQTAGVGVRGFATQAIGGLARFATSAAGITTIVGTIGVAVAAMAQSWSSAQSDIDRALLGIGARAGVTRDDINGMASAIAAGSKSSTAEARSALTEFAKSGEVFVGNFTNAAVVAKDFSVATGVTAAQGVSELNKFILGGSEGLIALNRQFGTLDGSLMRQLRTLEAYGDKQGMISVGLNAVASAVAKEADAIDPVTKKWNELTKAISDNIDAGRRRSAQVIERVTGVPLGGFNPQEQVERQRARVTEAQASLDAARPGSVSAANRADDVRKEEMALAELEAQLRKTAEAYDMGAARQKILSTNAEDFTNKIQPQIQQLIQLEGALKQLEQAKALGIGGPEIDATIAAYREQVNITKEALAADRQRVQVAEQLRARTGGVTLETAKQLNVLQANLAVARARTGQEQIAAQEVARVTQLVQAEVPLYDALKIAAGERAIAEAEVAKRFDDQIANMRLQTKILEAQGTATEAKLKAELAYQQAIQQGARPDQAAAIAAETKKQAEMQFARAAQQGVAALGQQVSTMHQLEQAAIDALSAAGGFVGTGIFGVMGGVVRTGPNAGTLIGSWLSPAREQSEGSAFGGSKQQTFGTFVEQVSDAAAFKTAQTLFGKGFEIISPAQKLTTVAFRDVTTTTFPGQSRPTEEGLTKIVDEILSKGGSLQEAINKLSDPNFLKDKKLFGIQPPDPTVLQNFLLDLYRRQSEMLGNVDEQRKFIQEQIAKLQAQPKTLATIDAIAELNRRLADLNQSTENLNDTMGNILSDIYTTDPRLSRIGFRADSGPLGYDPFKQATQPAQIIVNQTPIAPPATVGTTDLGRVGGMTGSTLTNGLTYTPPADTTNNFYDPNRTSFSYIQSNQPLGGTASRFAMGGIMGPWGPMPLDRFQSGGITRSPSMFMTSENFNPEAIIPLKNGSVPVSLAMPQAWERLFGEYQGGGRPPGEQVVNVNIENINVNGGASDDDARLTAFQMRQRMGLELSRSGVR